MKTADPDFLKWLAEEKTKQINHATERDKIRLQSEIAHIRRMIGEITEALRP